MKSKFRALQWMAVFAGIATPLASHAATFNLSNIDTSQFDRLVNEFSSNSVYSSVAPASSLGGLGSFEFGLVGGVTKAPDTLAVVKQSDPSTALKDNLYHAGGLVRVGLPYAFTLEGLLLPKIKISEAKFSRWAIAAQWTATDEMLTGLPLNLAAKFFYTKTTLNYSQAVTTTVNGTSVPATADIAFDNGLWGLQALASYKLWMLEPYLNVGYVKAKGTLNVDVAGNYTIFNTAFFGSGTKSATSRPDSFLFQLGTDFRLAFFSLGAEYQSAFSKNSYTGRLSFRF